MLGATDRRLAGRVERKAEEGESPHARHRGGRLRLRAHPAAERLAAGDERHPRAAPRRLGDGGAHRRVCHLRHVGPLRAARHVRELVAQRRDAASGQPAGDRGHERVRHAGAGAVPEHEARRRAGGRRQQPGHPLAGFVVADDDLDRLRCAGHLSRRGSRP
jgi:hypothetical protein